MTDKQLVIKYRNLLILLARHYVSMVEISRSVRALVGNETHGGKISGLHCQANTMQKQAYKLKGLLLEEGSVYRHFFGTINLFEIAKREIIISK